MMLCSGVGEQAGPAHMTPVPAHEKDSSAITFTHDLSECQDAAYPDYRGKLLLVGIKRGKKGWWWGGVGVHFSHPIGHS